MARLKLGIDIGQTTVPKYVARGRRPPSQGWKTFLHNHADGSFEDLKEHRAAAIRVLRQLGHEVSAMEGRAGAQPNADKIYKTALNARLTRATSSSC